MRPYVLLAVSLHYAWINGSFSEQLLQHQGIALAEIFKIRSPLMEH